MQYKKSAFNNEGWMTVMALAISHGVNFHILSY